MPSVDEPTRVDLRPVAPEPPDELLGLPALHKRVRRRRTARAVAGTLTIAALAAGGTTVGLRLTGSPDAGRTRLTTPAVSPTPSPTWNGHDCDAMVTRGRLTAPFWLDNDHFDPAPGVHPAHTQAQATAAYLANREARSFAPPSSHPQVFFANYGRVDVDVVVEAPVWVFLAHGVTGTSYGPSGGSFKTDAAVIFDDASLRLLPIVEALPNGSCLPVGGPGLLPGTPPSGSGRRH